MNVNCDMDMTVTENHVKIIYTYYLKHLERIHRKDRDVRKLKRPRSLRTGFSGSEERPGHLLSKLPNPQQSLASAEPDFGGSERIVERNDMDMI